MTDQKLKPCPFCGMALKVVDRYGLHPENRKCFLSNRTIRQEFGEFETWNTRATEGETNV